VSCGLGYNLNSAIPPVSFLLFYPFQILKSDVIGSFGIYSVLTRVSTEDYLYNWSCAPIDGGAKGTTNRESSGIGMVML
jgi:hypothetical protein